MGRLVACLQVTGRCRGGGGGCMRTWQQAAATAAATAPHRTAQQPQPSVTYQAPGPGPPTCEVRGSAQAVEVAGADAVHAEAAQDIKHLSCLGCAVAQGGIGSREAHQVSGSPGGASAVLVRQLAPHLCRQVIQQCRHCLGHSHHCCR
jgi:hypothetical protein